ncbi:MAG: thioredoxin [Cyanobacteriota bacterium]|jgi:thioredoxin|nr:thioredoxin [Cyanobacteriota bacterium]
MATTQKFHTFDDVLTSTHVPVLVDFYATWCGPCQMMAGILSQVNDQLKGQIKIIKIDTDKYPQIASQHGVAALPTLVLFKAGRPVDRIEGVLPMDQLVSRLRPHLG